MKILFLDTSWSYHLTRGQKKSPSTRNCKESNGPSLHGYGRKFWCEVSLFTQNFQLVLYTIFVRFSMNSHFLRKFIGLKNEIREELNFEK